MKQGGAEILLEVLLVFVLAVGVVLIAWCLTGLLLMPVFTHDMVTLCYARGNGDGLEQQIRAYGWLRDGERSGGRFLIVDCGLNEDGLHRTRILARGHDWVSCCSRQNLPEYLERLEDTI